MSEIRNGMTYYVDTGAIENLTHEISDVEAKRTEILEKLEALRVTLAAVVEILDEYEAERVPATDALFDQRSQVGRGA